MSPLNKDMLNRCADTVRFLAIDAIEKAKSGHPGMPMGMAKLGVYLFTRHLRFDPDNTDWRDRDRFILSAGHGSMLQYALLHLCGYNISLDDIKDFRQWGSKTPGHPEYGHTSGVEVTTGPLGQGFANGVGMAMAAKMLRARVDKEDEEWNPVEHRIVGIVSDGDLMEGISSEAASFAGHNKLGNILYFYDSNRISIEGETNLTFSEDIRMRFEAAGWYVTRCNGQDYDTMEAAMEDIAEETERPKLVIVDSHIGWGSPNKVDTADCHGAPLGPEEASLTKQVLNWPEDETFFVPEDVAEFFEEAVKLRKREREIWLSQLEGWKQRNPDLYETWEAHNGNPEWPSDLFEQIKAAMPEGDAPTRKLSGVALNAAAKVTPQLVGGSADLGPSNKTEIAGESFIAPGEYTGRNFHFGIREHAMGAIVNGMALYGGFKPYCATFLVFADYMRPPIRLAGLMKLGVTFVFTHDSIYVGEDGPTHQPIEHLESLRIIPNVNVWRPADGTECAAAYDQVLRRNDGPSVLCFSRQKLPALQRPEGFDDAAIAKGGYVVWESGETPEVVLIGTGSEVELALAAGKALADDGKAVRVVSIPCREIFMNQPYEYRREVLPHKTPKCVIEAGLTNGWWRIAGSHGLVIGLDDFGSSAPGKVVAEKLGLTAENITTRVKEWLQKREERSK